MILLALASSSPAAAGTFVFPVQSEQAVTGTTSGLAGAQIDDGVLEGLYEVDTSADPLTVPSSQSLATGSVVSGTFPNDISSTDGALIRYREAIASTDTIAFDAASGYAQDTEASVFAWTHTASGADRLLVVGIAIRNNASQAATSVTYGGAPLTLLRGDSNGVSVRSELWYRIAPATGANSLVVTLSGSAKAAMGAISLTGVSQSSPVDGQAGTTGSSGFPSVTVTTVTDHAWVVGAVAFRSTGNGAPTGTAGLGQTERWSRYTESGGGGVNVRGKGSSEGPSSPAGAVAMDWSLSASVDWAISGASFRPIGIEEAGIAYRSNTGTNTVSSPKTRPWDGSTWGSESEESSAGSPLRLVRMAWSPIVPSTRIIVTLSDDGWLDAYVCTPACTVTNNIGQVWGMAPGQPERRFDIAYEHGSGDALLVYGVLSTDPAQDIAYRTFSGGSWSAEQYLDDPGHGTDVQYSLIMLASRSGMDQIGLLGGDTTNDDANAWIWDGSGFGSNTEITGGAQNPDRERGAIAWESNSGHLLALAVNGGTEDLIVWKEYTTGWSSAFTQSCGSPGNNIRWLSLKPNPLATANDMVLAVGDDDSDLNTCYWTGNAWTTRVSHDTAIDAAGTRAFDFAWEESGGNGLLVYGTNAGQITYETFTAPSTWSGATSVAMGANAHAWVQLRTNPFPQAGDTRILGAVLETTASDLGGIKWDGSVFTVIGASTFTADVGTTSHENFDLKYRARDNDRLILRYDWTGVPAGSSYALQVEGQRSNEDILVQVLTPPATWTTRITINAATAQLYTIPLTTAEFNGGSPQVQFADTMDADGSASDLYLERVAILTVIFTHSLEIRQDITGIIAGSNPVLVVKGNVSAGGENFHVHVWNFSTSGWDLLLTAPFTAANAYHNVSLSSDFLFGGTVRLRFVDAASDDAILWSLSLDFVAVAITNEPVTLSNPGVSPASGDVSTGFSFFVRYTDPESAPPSFVNLTLNGTSYSMIENDTADVNFADGKDYFITVVVGIRGTFNFTFSARASSGDLAVVWTSVQQVFVLNRPPGILDPIGSDTVHTGRAYVRDFSGTDPDNDSLSWSISTNGSWLSIGPGNGTVWGVAASTTSSFYVDVTVFDGFGGFAAVNYSLSVGNLRPTITTPTVGTLSSFRRGVVQYDLNATDADGDVLTWTLQTNASFLSIGAGTGTVFGVAASVPGAFWFEATVSDGFGGVDRRTVTLLVLNRPPQVAVSAPSSVSAEDPYSGTFSGTDPDDDPLTWSISTNATWLAIDPSTGDLSGTPIPGVYYVNLTARDPYGGVASYNFTITVASAPVPPPGPTPGGLRGEPWFFLLIALAFVALCILVIAPRRRPLIEAAFALDRGDQILFQYAAPDTRYDEPRLRRALGGVRWRETNTIRDPPYSLHTLAYATNDWILISRSGDSDRVTRSAQKFIARVARDIQGFAVEPEPSQPAGQS